MDWQIGDERYIVLFLLLPLLAWVLFRYVKWTKNRRNLFAEERFQKTLFEKKNGFSKMLPFIYLLAFLFLILSFIDFTQGGEKMKVKQKMNNVLFLLDISNSMNAEDVQPNRLVEAKNIMFNTLSQMKNDRVGVVIFAGEAVSIMPLTTDYNAVENYISAIETQTIKVQGTDFLKAMEVAVTKFKNVAKGSRKVILISDGEDNEGNDEKAIALAKKEGVKIVSVGVGTTDGAPIPEYVFGQFMGYKTNRNGEPVLTKKQTLALENLANSTGGDYINVENLDQTTNDILKSLDKGGAISEVSVDTQNTKHYYQYFLGVALCLFFILYYVNPKRDFNI